MGKFTIREYADPVTCDPLSDLYERPSQAMMGKLKNVLPETGPNRRPGD